jgi:hypothetical protein
MNDFQKRQEQINKLSETAFTTIAMLIGCIGIVLSTLVFISGAGQVGLMIILQSFFCFGIHHLIRNQNKQNLILYEILKKIEKPDKKEEPE